MLVQKGIPEESREGAQRVGKERMGERHPSAEVAEGTGAAGGPGGAGLAVKRRHSVGGQPRGAGDERGGLTLFA